MRVFAIVLHFVLLVSTAAAQPKLDPPNQLAWGMTLDRATAVLKAAKLDPKYEELRGYFAESSGSISHTTEPQLVWKIPNGRVVGRFAWDAAASASVLDRVEMTLELTKPQLARELASLQRRFGKPHKSTPEHRLWVRGGIWLVVIPAKDEDPKTHRFPLIVNFRRDATPAP